MRFLDDGRIEIDSNTVERAMPPIALSRKNALFAGSDERLPANSISIAGTAPPPPAAGLTSATSSMTVALKAMQDAAARDLASADAATAKAKLLRPTQPEEDDPNIAAALASVSGTSPAPQTLSDRLAALKARSGS